jgi:hypothetical protein
VTTTQPIGIFPKYQKIKEKLNRANEQAKQHTKALANKKIRGRL